MEAAKQEAFEESIRLTNQFRSLDEDEVEFLDSVMESTRAQEAAVRKENREQLEAFRKQQEETEQAAKEAEAVKGPEEVEQGAWTVGRKRKKGKDTLFGGLKLRRSSTTEKEMGAEHSTASKAAATPSPSTAASQQDDTSLKTATREGVAAPPAQTMATPADGEAVGRVPKPPAASKVDKPQVPAQAASLGLGLGAYSSDSDDDG